MSRPEAARRPSPPEVDRRAASEAAIAARRARAVVKKAVASGRRPATAVLAAAQAEPLGVEGRMRVSELLRSVPALGVVKTPRVMEQLRIAESKRLGGLGRRQVEGLASFLEEREARRRSSRNRLLVLAGPTAVGKGTVSTYIRENYPEVLLSVSATTRAPRPGEVDGVSYYFVDDAEFDRMIAAGEFLEYAVVHNAHRYGTPRGPIDAALEQGRQVMLEIDIQGARQVRERMPDARLVFLLPPSWDELVRRLVGRGTESAEEQERRLTTAKVELAAQDEFDVAVVNSTVPEAAREVVELMVPRADDPPADPGR
ncbi:guanylate kinase [Rathayibacter rathayi]|uniref:Guanylate kinase n=1 Tax=Rathayibacter rathayi TaxID=33887 RepID=A0ABD6WCH9_RATRA|nr:guanylate kinase [Rathayibacter rathayi]AZZ48686.1 guanylate kinase [Rathayibacter rathayi]MWV73761.1 guanylate kinase [Rathayibacter rathayi NCPPB 2980 = VKM Ac-1601]PPF15783.1 guanylate kinase [Rathayibacter rathayi]PPF25294.1 guanylate kinase [Rathayibacter rathayi]PPF50870.1 guanylate kinase [Rathayibacter rathayi]